MRKIITVGETTYDIIFRQNQPTGAVVGGSVLNTSVTLGRLKQNIVFVTRMGNDQIGEISIDFLRENGVSAEYVRKFKGNSRLALAFLDEQSNADYSFYKAQKAPDLQFPVPNADDIVVYGSTNAVRDEGRNPLLLFLNEAHDKGVLSVYDPNIREFDPVELVEVRRKFEENLYLTKVLKGSKVDFFRLYGTYDPDEIFSQVSLKGINTLIITSGAEPVELRTKNISISVPVKQEKAVSTIGAGDNFTAGLVFGIVKNKVYSDNLLKLSSTQWTKIIKDASDCASNVCKTEFNYITNAFAKEFLMR